MRFAPILNLLFCLTFLSLNALAQKYTVSGVLRDQSSGENLIGGSLFNVKTAEGTTTNNYGFFSLTLRKDSVQLRVSYVGYETSIFKFYLHKDTTINISLSSGTQLREVIIDATAEDEIQNSSRMGSIDVPIEQIKSAPALLGETDVLKVLQLLPGVQAGTEGSSGLYVRGGGPDQNLILLDGVPVYNASHLFGFFSVFNADAINHVELIKGGFPARFGGRLSSVIDISMKEGNLKKFKGEGSIGLVASKITLEGPIKKDQTSFIVSARRTYIDLLARPIIKSATPGDEVPGYYFYDVNAKVNHRINDKNRLFISTYLGDDRAYSYYNEDYYKDNQHVTIGSNYGLNWGNITTAVRWNKLISNKLFGNLTATYSRYRFNIFEENKLLVESPDTASISNNTFREYVSGIRDYAIKLDFDYLPNPNHFIKFGSQVMHHLFTPGVFTYNSTQERDTTLGAKKIYATEFFGYVEDDIHLSSKLKVNLGVHASGFYVDQKFYRSVQPRISGRYLLTPKMSLKASYAQMTQYIHLLTNAGLGLPTDLWVPSTPTVGPEKSYLISSGAAYNLNRTYEISLEGYYKTMTGLIEYKEGASYFDIEKDWQTKVEIGEGESYGAEFFLQKKTGKLTGWIGYTLSWTNRTFPNIDFGRTFPYKYDRRHDIDFTLAYQIDEHKALSATWVYGTGNAITLASDSYTAYHQFGNFNRYIPSRELENYDGRNNFRMQPYHRLDISYTIKKKTRWGERSWTWGLYNAYNRKNPFFMDIGTDKKGHKKFIQYSLFPVIPSFSFQFKF